MKNPKPLFHRTVGHRLHNKEKCHVTKIWFHGFRWWIEVPKTPWRALEQYSLPVMMSNCATMRGNRKTALFFFLFWASMATEPLVWYLWHSPGMKFGLSKNLPSHKKLTFIIFWQMKKSIYKENLIKKWNCQMMHNFFGTFWPSLPIAFIYSQ